MFEFDQLVGRNILLLSIGSILGTCLRFYSLNYLCSLLSRKYLATFLVNTAAAFSLGLVTTKSSLEEVSSNSSGWVLFVCIGFLGGFSTFSTFLLEVFETFLKSRYKESFLLATYSVLGGLFAAAAGLGIGNIF